MKYWYRVPLSVSRFRLQIHDFLAVLRIRDVHPGSDFFPSQIPDPNFSIPDPGSASKNLSILPQKKWFLSSRKYDPGCLSRISDPVVKKAPDPGSGSATLVMTRF